ncbi:MAG: TetR/AcrR family transcriptional regulator [Nannocystaceae bacterium]
MPPDPPRTRDLILDAAIPLVGSFGLKKTSVEDLARAAGLSKQGLYLHFASKEELLTAAMERYFDEGLRLTREALGRPDVALQERLVDALDAWFGRHLAHFRLASLEVLEPGERAASAVDRIKRAYCKLLERAIADAPEHARRGHVCTPAELSRVLFQFGLTWKEGHASRAAFRETLRLCVRACFPEGAPPSRATKRRAR